MQRQVSLGNGVVKSSLGGMWRYGITENEWVRLRPQIVLTVSNCRCCELGHQSQGVVYGGAQAVESDRPVLQSSFCTDQLWHLRPVTSLLWTSVSSNEDEIIKPAPQGCDVVCEALGTISGQTWLSSSTYSSLTGQSQVKHQNKGKTLETGNWLWRQHMYEVTTVHWTCASARDMKTRMTWALSQESFQAGGGENTGTEWQCHVVSAVREVCTCWGHGDWRGGQGRHPGARSHWAWLEPPGNGYEWVVTQLSAMGKQNSKGTEPRVSG